MIDNPTRRVAAILLTALMLLSTIIVVIPQDTASAAGETNDIMIKVQDSVTRRNIPGATVKFTEVHTGQVFTATYSAADDAYHSGSSVPAGYYRIDISASRYYSYKNLAGFRFDGLSPTTLDTVPMIKFANDEYTLTVAVKDASGLPISGATVMLYNRTMRQQTNSSTTDSGGQTAQKVFRGAVLDLAVSALTHEMNITQVGPFTGSSAITVVLNNSLMIYRDAKKMTGTGTSFASNVISYMYNKNTSVPWEKRVLRSTGSSVTFDAYPGDWMLVIDGSDVNPYLEDLGMISSGSSSSLILNNQSQSIENRIMTWNSWNSLTIENNAVWNADHTYPGLDFSDIGSLRAQVDLTLGNGDGIVSDAERIIFSVYYLQNTHGPDYVTTGSLLHVQEIGGKNKTQYISIKPANFVSVGNFSGLVTDTSNITYASNVGYTTQVTLQAFADFYQITPFNVTLDSASMNRSFTLNLLSGYELVGNSSDTPLVSVSGYTAVTVNPLISSVAGTGHLALSVDKSENPVVKGEVVESPYTYAKMLDRNVSYYVVRANKNISFSAEESSDPDGNPLTYSWDFGESQTSTKNKIAYYNYTTSHDWNVTLTVTDVVGKTNTTNFTVRVDGCVPRPDITVINTTGSILTLPIEIDQGDSLKFSPAGSVDDLISAGDGLGLIQSYEWKFGNDTPFLNQASETDQNETYQFNIAGTIKVILNVTDVVGNCTNKTISISVRDKTAPEVNVLTSMNSTWGASLLERSVIYFDATKTIDNIDNVSALDFNWSFGDGTAKIGGIGLSNANVTHNYSSYGQYNLVLNVTDTSGNNLSLKRTIYIGMGPRPDVYPDKVSFDSTLFEESVSGKITVNITNKGSATATGISIELWWYSGTTAQKRVGNITGLFDANGTPIQSLAVGQSGYGSLDWIPDAKGNYSIRAIVNSTDQPSSNWGSGTIEVKEASWKGIVLPVGLLILVIAIPLLLLARRRIGSMGAMIRRPKKEKEPKKEEKDEMKK